MPLTIFDCAQSHLCLKVVNQVDRELFTLNRGTFLWQSMLKRDYVVLIIKNPTLTGLNTETPNASTVHPTVPAGR